MLKILLPAICCIVPFLSGAAPMEMSLKTALDKGLVKIAASSTGATYNGKALRLKITNQTKESIKLSIDPALIFRPDDSSYQDLVLPGTEMLVLASSGTGMLNVQTFCGKLHASAPGHNLNYTFHRQGDSTMIKVARYINTRHLYDGLGQAAIWALTDHHNLQGIIDDARPKESADLLALMAKLTGWAVPEYFKLYKISTVAGQPVFEQRVLKILTDFEWKVVSTVNLRMGIYNEAGDEVQSVFFKEFNKGNYKLRVEFEAANVPPGKYFIRLLDAASTLREQMVVVD